MRVTFHSWFTLAVLAVTLALLIRGRTTPALIILGADILLLVAGVVTPAQALMVIVPADATFHQHEKRGFSLKARAACS